MNTVPRVRDTLQIRPARPHDDGTLYELVDHRGRSRLRLDEAGRFFVLRLDGEATFDELRGAFRERFGRDLEAAGFDRAVQRLAGAGLLTTDERALHALRALWSRGVRYRSVVRDRRLVARAEGPDRRRPEGVRPARAFDEALHLLAEGAFDESLAAFRALLRERPFNTRLRLVVSQVEAVLAEVHPQARVDGGPDEAWAEFDRALSDGLAEGLCPRCDAPVVVDRGEGGMCGACGAAYSAYAMRASVVRRA